MVAFLTQDATPASEEWLSSILEGFAQADDVALVFGPHVPRPGHSHVFAREMRDHFRTWGEGKRIDVQRLDRSPDALAEYRLYPYRLQFFSDVNGAVARFAWERVPYREVPYAEDQLLAREMIEAGYAKVFHPGAAVYHSHDYPPTQFLRRYFDEFRSLREVLGHVESFGLEHVARTVYHQTRLDREFLAGEGVQGEVPAPGADQERAPPPDPRSRGRPRRARRPDARRACARPFRSRAARRSRRSSCPRAPCRQARRCRRRPGHALATGSHSYAPAFRGARWRWNRPRARWRARRVSRSRGSCRHGAAVPAVT